MFAVTESNRIYFWNQAELASEIAANGEPSQSTLPKVLDTTDLLAPEVTIVDLKSGNLQTIILTTEKKVYRIDHPQDMQGEIRL
jgi:hypothetical protein